MPASGLSFSIYPTGGDLQLYLESLALTVPAALKLRLQSLQYAAVQEFEKQCDRIFLAPTATAVRYFDPPTNVPHGSSNYLRVPDLYSITSIVYTPTGGTATTLVVNDDYMGYPHNAVALGRAFTAVEIFGWRWMSPLAPSYRRSIAITGRWGYGTTLPPDVREAMLALGALKAWNAATFGVTGGLGSWSEGDVKEDYGKGWDSASDAWKAQVAQAVANYRRFGL